MVEQARPQQLSDNFPLPADISQPADSVVSPQDPKLKTQNSLSPTYNLKLNTYNSPPLRVIAAIPCFNTQSTIAAVVTKTKKYVDQVIVIDDGSTDQTADLAGKAGATIVSHGVNKGYGAAIKSCFQAAKAENADILVIIDGDGQHNPDEIPYLLSFSRNG
jgi:cellulose synthase/poly-beta-1,6-N-acetylglucosamine synthase-like glycosyltransferase